MTTEQPVLPSSSQSPSKNSGWGWIIFFLVFGFITSFGAGYLLRSIASPEITPVPTTRPTDTPVASGEVPQASGERELAEFKTGKHYFDDTLILISKDAPHYALVATAARGERQASYRQSTRVSFYDGKNWKREVLDQTTDSPSIFSNKMIARWSLFVDPSRVLKESVGGEYSVGGVKIKASTESFFNEISMRSLPGYTKLMSPTTGVLTVNGKDYPAYALYTKIYSLNGDDIQFYSSPLGVTTDWVALWDSEGNFYHVDKTNVERPTTIYKSHQIGVKVDADKRVSKTFEVSTTRDASRTPEDYVITLNDPIGEKLVFKRSTMNDKAPAGSYVWYTGHAEGSVVNASGNEVSALGLVEYIKD